MRGVARESWQCVRRHWLHLLIAPAMLISFTVLHESAHALVAWLQGGTIREFVVLPGDGRWGYVRYDFPAGHAYSAEAISLAPYAMWLGIMSLVVALSLRNRPLPFWVASSLFVWGYVGAFGDIVNAWLPWSMRKAAGNDFAHAFGAAGPEAPVFVIVAAAIVAVAGYAVHRRLYGERAVGLAAFVAVGGASMVGLAGLFVLVL